MSERAIRVGLIGLGRMGRNHLRVLTLLKGVEVVFAFDPDSKAARWASNSYGIPVTNDLDAAFEICDAVVIASPTPTHAEMIVRASRSVKNIFVEKPLAGELAEAEAIAELEARANLNLQVGFIERFNPAVTQLYRVCQASAGVINLDFSRTNKISSRITDVDVISDLMIHDLDLALYLNGSVDRIEANGRARGDMIEFATAILTHRSGAYSRVLASRITEKKIRRIEATCVDMYVDCDLLRKELLISRQSEVMQPVGEPYTITAQEQTLEVPPHEALLLELQAFLVSCRGEIPSNRPDAEAGLAATRLAAKVRDTILSGG